ncbi:hypothetical protein [Allosphingosinicella indica]|uniref:Type 1 fimbrial protein n=1 Tax=Allosphingosinicella indica TaxID=941907 RepID=A0A1X7G6M1_9SPHN|nr:hypothetical protein [Allosphingosinicella indica]SMF64963.1 hypothetical protein SAMN06295910_1266 [Allosphingosinicella indica]
MIRAALLLALAAVAGPAFAQDAELPDGGDQSDFIVTGSVPELCTLGEPTISNTSAPLNVRTIIGRVIRIEEMMDPATLSTQAASIEIAFQGFCNYPYEIALASDNNGLYRQIAGGAVPLGFANAVPYMAELRRDEDMIRLDADALSRRERRGAPVDAEPTASPLLLRLQVMPGATNITTQAPLLAGEYRDTIRITVGPR